MHADNAGEFVSMPKTLENMGITLITSSAYSRESSGLSERINRVLMDKMRTLIKKAGLREEF